MDGLNARGIMILIKCKQCNREVYGSSLDFFLIPADIKHIYFYMNGPNPQMYLAGASFDEQVFSIEWITEYLERGQKRGRGDTDNAYLGI